VEGLRSHGPESTFWIQMASVFTLSKEPLSNYGNVRRAARPPRGGQGGACWAEPGGEPFERAIARRVCGVRLDWLGCALCQVRSLARSCADRTPHAPCSELSAALLALGMEPSHALLERFRALSKVPHGVDVDAVSCVEERVGAGNGDGRDADGRSSSRSVVRTWQAWLYQRLWQSWTF
jgi:hypothetical protein